MHARHAKTQHRNTRYRCALVTSNGAHWTGRIFTLIVNAYTEETHAKYTHSIYDVTELDAGSAGCSTSLYDFDVTSETGSFKFKPGNCKQKIRLDCRGAFQLEAAAGVEPDNTCCGLINRLKTMRLRATCVVANLHR